jgi:hypothetical protein
MEPALKSGLIYLALKTKDIKIGDYVVFKNTKLENKPLILVKKVIEKENNLLWVSGLKPESTSSKELGWIEIENVLGKILL